MCIQAVLYPYPFLRSGMVSSSRDLASLHRHECAFAEARGIPSAALVRVHEIRQSLAPTGLDVAALVVAPVLSGFAAWLAEHIRASGAKAFGVMREGRFLCRLLYHLHGIDAREIALNRHIGLLAAYAAGDDEALVNWLVRTRIRPLGYAELAALSGCDAKMFPDNATIDLAAAQKLVAQWRGQGKASPIHALAERARLGLEKHWRKIVGDREARNVALVDFACAGNVQRSLQTVLRHMKDHTPLEGLNFATTRGTIWAKQKGCAMRGFLSEDGEPAWIAEAYGRSPEVMEIFVAAPEGPLTGYTGEGDPLWGRTHLSADRLKRVAEWQEAILKTAKIFQEAMGPLLAPELCRCLWGRFLLAPLPHEVTDIADWPLDAGLDGYASRTLAPRLDGEKNTWTKAQTAWPAASAKS
jgi:hypothetical protein